MPIRLVVADDHRIVLDGLVQLLQLQRDFEVVASCRSGRETIEAARVAKPDILLLDLALPDMSGLDVARQLRHPSGRPRIVLLTASIRPEQVVQAVEEGIRGLVLKELAPQLLIECIRTVHAGGTWLERQVSADAFAGMAERHRRRGEAQQVLTPREIEIARMVSVGLRNRDIADRLCISEATVKTHLHRIYEKLGIDGRAALGHYAREHGLM